MATKGGNKGGKKSEAKGGTKGETNEETRCETDKSRPELSKDEVDEMTEWFYFFDKNNDQKLDKEELRRVLQAMCWNVTDKELDNIFSSADTDNNGYIDYDEYLRLLDTFRKDPYLERLELIEAFRHFDKDRSGTIDSSELRRFLLTKGHAYADRDRRDVENLIKQADTHGTGSVNIEEFVDLILNKPIRNKSKF